ncbi:MAG: hypothetical protein FJ091_07975 [Deltaproteobacteria bacterium]|nr:hypothetical protein [Deltaproteobacteria bacterium]
MADAALCAHLASLAPGAGMPEIAHAFLFQSGAIDAVVRCPECGAHALLRMLDWAPPAYTARVYSLAALREADVALYLRNLARGSCQVSRASAELDALVASAGACERLVALDVASERLIASAPLPQGLSGEPALFPARLPRANDERWFAALGLTKSEVRSAAR